MDVQITFLSYQTHQESLVGCLIIEVISVARREVLAVERHGVTGSAAILIWKWRQQEVMS
jgi:hypothetical protein